MGVMVIVIGDVEAQLDRIVSIAVIRSVCQTRPVNEMGIAYHPQGLSEEQTESFRSALQAIYPQLKNNDVRKSIEKALNQMD